ncbi:MAG TPA: DUF3043 domain-containing protein [Aeromicrobium sp.]|nr:DUF3043 domain-containing protein [Aeromicrobium sp.]
MTKENPTPTRKEAEAARKKALKQPMTRKEQLARDREARKQIRRRQQDALRSGEEKYLPLRDRGPIKRFCRDYVDRRRLVAEYLLPILVVTFLMTMLPQPAAQSVGMLIWMAATAITVIEEFLVIRGLRKELARRFPGQSTRGVTLYTIMRTTQLRRFRLPAAQVKRFEKLPERY